MNTEDNFKNLCDLTTNLVGLPKGSLALKTRKTQYQVARMVAAMVARLEDETHRETIANVLDRHRTSINHYERTHSAYYSSFALYRDTFNKVFNAYTEIKDAKLKYSDYSKHRSSWDGKSAKRIVKILEEKLNDR